MDFLKKEMRLDRKYVILFVIFNFLILGIYYTYSIFVVRQIKEDISLISVRSNVLAMTSNNLTNNSITVASNTISNITINVSNSVSSKMYYRIIHEGVPTGVAVYETNSDHTSVGEILGSGSVTSTITIENTTNSEITVVFKCQESTKEYFDIEMGYSYVNIEKNFDHSGASSPYDDLYTHALFDNMIPVYYDQTSTTEGVWKIADYYNIDGDHIWYDYDNFRWANVVTVTATNREMYLSSPVGTEVALSDINSFYVWVPEYKYYIISENGNTATERVINVKFVGEREDIDNYGTVECVESISNEEDKHTYSEICTDYVNDWGNGKIYNNLSTYYHPAFNYSYTGGIWVSKFATINSSSASIKPNSSLSSTSYVSTINIKNMKNDGNVYGFVDGYAIDIHMMTSMDWGAVAILSSSQYGKSGNPMYQTDTLKSFTRIYNNTSNYYSGRSTNYTTSSTSVSNSSTTTVYYNDLTDVTNTYAGMTYPIGYKGAGASTTGTVYGIYDMAGGNYTTVLGVFMNEDGTMPYTIDSEHYTKYSYVDHVGILNDYEDGRYIEVFRLGDGVKEHVRSFTENGMWQNGSLIFNNKGIMRRGGYTTNGSIFTTEIVDSTQMHNTFVVIYHQPK